jgi:transposase
VPPHLVLVTPHTVVRWHRQGWRLPWRWRSRGGPGCAARLLLAAGDHPTRRRSDAALAALCGASPFEASSGTVPRHRLNRGGDRQANHALWTVASNRLWHHPETRSRSRRTASSPS